MRLRSYMYLATMAVFVLATSLSYQALSLLLDPYNIVWQRPVMPVEAYVAEQYRTAKIRDLAKHSDQIDGIILGNSRGFALSASAYNLAANRHYFNFSVSVDTPYGFAQKTKWLIGNLPRLRNVILLLAFDEFRTLPAPEALIYREHPDVSGQTWISYYWAFSNLPLPTFWRSLRYYIKSMFGLPTDPATIVNSGFDERSGDGTMIANFYSDLEPSDEERKRFAALESNDPPGVIRFHGCDGEPRCTDRPMQASDVAAIKGYFAASVQELQWKSLDQLLEDFDSAGVRATCVVVPVPTVVMDWILFDDYLGWLKRLVARCGGIWDFSIPNGITRDNYNFLDWSHYIGYVGSMIMFKVGGLSSSALERHADFGRYVTAAELPAYATEFRKSIRRANTAVTP
jgi:hypothetical protein